MRKILIVAVALLCARSDNEIPTGPEASPIAEGTQGTPNWVRRVRAARATLRPHDEGLLGKITEEYNLGLRGHTRWAENCLAYESEFRTAARLTLYPVAYIAGIAMHESAGCRMDARDWAGGRGLMQITSVPRRRYTDDIAKLLRIRDEEVDYRRNPLHNILMGVMYHDDLERELGSRQHGLLAYNMGAGGVRKKARKLGWNGGEPLPSIVELKPYLAHNARMKPRAYVQKVLASVIMMDRALRGLPLERRDVRRDGNFTPEDIPGWDPADDGG